MDQVYDGGIFSTLVGLVIAVLSIASLWKLFIKAGQPGWAAVVPIYNVIVLLRILGLPLWCVVLLFIPYVNFILGVALFWTLAKAFGKGVGFGLGLVLAPPIFMAILAFGDAKYVGADTPANADSLMGRSS